MATSDPNSTLPDWANLYGAHNQGMTVPTTTMRQQTSMSMSMSMPDLTLVNTTATSGRSGMTGAASSPPSHANMETGARVGKSPRRRSRASRRAPVTLLNTDTGNFRAMVQQFTGIPSGAYPSGNLQGSSSGGSGPTISFGLDFSTPMRPSGGVMSFGQQQQPQQYQRQQLPFQEQIFHSRQQQQYHEYGENNMFTGGGGGGGGGGGEFSSNSVGDNNNNNNMFMDGGGYVNEGIFVENNSQMMPKAATNSATNIIRGDHGYFG